MASVTDATKEKKGEAAALALARTVDHILVAKGKQVVEFDMKKAPPPDEELLRHLLGPTGNLRAPTVRHDKTLLVGFNEDAYSRTLIS